MPSKHRISISITPEFEAWLQKYADERGFKSLAEALVDLAEFTANEEGFTGRLMLGRGKYEREIEAIMEAADRITDGGRNDPAE